MIQQVNTTHEEKVRMYMKRSKKELAEMLALRDALEGERIIPVETITTTSGDGDQLIFANFSKKFIEGQKDIDPEIHAYVQKNFWDLI